jgi:ribokinase
LTVVVIGNATVDLSYDVPRLPLPGETVLARAKRVDAGGKGLNQAIVARRAGAEVVYCAPLGRDALAEVILERLQAEGLEGAPLRRVPVPTDESLIFIAPGGENAIVSTAAAAQSLDEAAAAPVLALLGAGDLLLMQGNLTREITHFCLQRARAAGARTLLNPAPIAFDYAKLLPAVDIAVVNAIESESLSGEADRRAAAEALRHAGAGTVVTTLGSEGACLLDGDGERRVPAPAVEAVDTTGAGDVFCGVLAAALEARLDREMALRWAVAAASLKVTRRGTASAFPGRDELLRLRKETLAGAGQCGT